MPGMLELINDPRTEPVLGTERSRRRVSSPSIGSDTEKLAQRMILAREVASIGRILVSSPN